MWWCFSEKPDYWDIRHTYISRKGKNCYIQRKITYDCGDKEFIGAKHKLSLSQCRTYILLKEVLRNRLKI